MFAARIVPVVLCISLAACGVDEADVDGPVDDAGAVSLEARTALTPREVAWTIPSAKGRSETRKVFKTASAFNAYFGAGSARAAGIDFVREWAVFYSAGVKRTGGYAASIPALEVSESGKTLYVTTKLDSPGAGCLVTQALTKPTALVAFRRPPTKPGSNRYLRADESRDCDTGCESDAECADGEICNGGACGPEITCRTSRCAPGFHCTMTAIQCVRAPCPEAMPNCIEDATTCEQLDCGPSSYCVESDGLANCVKRTTTCATILCADGTYCSQAFGEARCINYPSCMTARCAAGTTCHDDPVTECEYAECPPTRPVCR